MEATIVQARGPNRRGAGLDLPLHYSGRRTKELGVRSSPRASDPLSPGLASSPAERNARGRAAESHGSRPQVREFGDLKDPGLRPATPPPLPFLSPSFPTQCPQAGRERSTNELALLCTALALHLASVQLFPTARKAGGHQPLCMEEESACP